jgi:hypothetical protein
LKSFLLFFLWLWRAIGFLGGVFVFCESLITSYLSYFFVDLETAFLAVGLATIVVFFEVSLVL